MTLYLPEGIMGGTLRTEAEARGRELRIEDRPQNLGYGLLDHAIQHGGNAEKTLSSLWFRNTDPAYRLRPVPALQQRLADRGPVRACKHGEVFQGHPVTA